MKYDIIPGSGKFEIDSADLKGWLKMGSAGIIGGILFLISQWSVDRDFGALTPIIAIALGVLTDLFRRWVFPQKTVAIPVEDIDLPVSPPVLPPVGKNKE